jgi:hypothetical protein
LQSSFNADPVAFAYVLRSDFSGSAKEGDINKGRVLLGFVAAFPFAIDCNAHVSDGHFRVVFQFWSAGCVPYQYHYV